MRRTFGILAALALLACLPSSTSALTTMGGNNIVTDHTSTVKDIYAAGGSTVDASATFSDDVLLAGGTVSETGPVSGDVLAGGGTVKVSGDVKGSVRVAGGTVTIDSKISRNVVVMGGTVTIGSTADIAGEILAFGGTIYIDGHVAKHVSVWGGSVSINGKLDGDVSVHTGGNRQSNDAIVRLGANAVIGGNLTYWSTKDASIDSGAKVGGTTVRHPVEDQTARFHCSLNAFLNVVRLWNLFSLLVVGLAVGLLFPRTVTRTAETMLARSGASIGWGVLVLLAFPLGFIILCATVIGIPLGFLLLGLYVAGIYLSQVFLGFLVGERLMRLLRRKQVADGTKPVAAVWIALFGVAITVLIMDFVLAPLGSLSMATSFIVGIIRLFLLIWSFGALIMTAVGTIRERERA